MLALTQVAEIVALKPAHCEQCGAGLTGADPFPHRQQVSDLPPVQPVVTEYRRHTLPCQACGQRTKAPLPAGAPPGSFGPRVQALVGYLTGRLGVSQRDVVEACHTLYNLKLSLGSVAALQRQVSAALAQPVQTAQAYVQQQAVRYVDETGWREATQTKWLWLSATPRVTVFRLLAGRGQTAARTVLGPNRSGIIITDRYAAYQGVAPAQRQFCWAHLKRDFQALVERDDESAKLGTGLLQAVHTLFAQWHQYRAGQLNRPAWQQAMAVMQTTVRAWLEIGRDCQHPKTRGLCRQLLKHEASLWTFVRVAEVEPTNNNAERALRRAVLWRRKSFGTQSATGSQFVERILTAVTTLRQQQRNVLAYLTAACRAALGAAQDCCLVPDTS